jgi:hypothetical protein
MATIINETKRIMEQLEKEGKTEIMDKPEHLKMFDDIDKLMEEVTRDYNYKSGMSAIHARDCWVYQNSN